MQQQAKRSERRTRVGTLAKPVGMAMEREGVVAGVAGGIRDGHSGQVSMTI